MKKKLIFLTSALWIGGIERSLVNLLKALDGEKYEITLLILEKDRTLAGELPPHVRLRCLHREAYPFTWLHHLTELPENPSPRHRRLLWAMPGAKWVENWLFDRYVRRCMARERFDTAVIYSDAAARTAVRAIRAEKLLLFYHHGTARRVPGDGAAWRKCVQIVVNSAGMAEALKAFRPRYAHKIVCIPNLMDGEAVGRNAAAFDPGFPPGKFHIVTVGRLHRDKGMDLAVAAADLLRSRGIPIHWWIVGGGPEKCALRRQIEALGLENTVTLLGMRENPYPYMAAADLYIQPSRVEAYGLSIAEAQILGRPIIATDTPGARAQLPPEMCCPISAEAIADTVERWLRSPPPASHRDWAAENRVNLQKLEALF